MRVGIVGSRRRNSMADRYQVFSLVENLKRKHGDTLTIISGGCRKGADSFAEEAARAYGVPMVIHPVDTSEPIRGRWEYREKAFARNLDIAKDSDVLYAWISDDRTGGTENTISHMKNLQKDQIYVVLDSGEVYLDDEGRAPKCEPVMHL